MIRRATASDRHWVLATGVTAYRELGDYQRILPTWLDQSGVLTWVFESGNVRRGMAMLAFYGEPGFFEPMPIVADLLALAVPAEFQGAGVGRQLLSHVIEVASRIAASTNATKLRLTVAKNNERAQRLYHRAGFVEDPSVTSTYESGIAGMRMIRPLL
jgi:ribosomal protein S18 acetylase RimI-like enzyme